MILTPIDITPKIAKILSFTARDRYAPNRCKHMHIIVDTDLAEVECQDCGAKLNPVATLARMATEETRWANEGRRAKEAMAELSKRVRCKCRHCGQMTTIG